MNAFQTAYLSAQATFKAAQSASSAASAPGVDARFDAEVHAEEVLGLPADEVRRIGDAAYQRWTLENPAQVAASREACARYNTAHAALEAATIALIDWMQGSVLDEVRGAETVEAMQLVCGLARQPSQVRIRNRVVGLALAYRPRLAA